MACKAVHLFMAKKLIVPTLMLAFKNVFCSTAKKSHVDGVAGVTASGRGPSQAAGMTAVLK